MLLFKTFSSRYEAEIIRDLFESAGISCKIVADDLGGAYPHLSLIRGVQIWIHDQDQTSAQSIMDSIERSQ